MVTVMIARNDDHVGPRPAHIARLEGLAQARRKHLSAECARLRRKVVQAEALLERDPDAASLLLDGALAALAAVVSHRVGAPSVRVADPLNALRASDPLLALRLRLALRAPDVRARIIHVRGCLDCLERVLLAGQSGDAESS
jgi:hypothetical protein